ncbi:MAG: hypothetical protein EXR71_11160 [Myxococcales bacterium]|nr:hypothetical protein [Myxococcales bacterium]
MADALAMAWTAGDARACGAIAPEHRDTCELGLVSSVDRGARAELCRSLPEGGVAATECWFRVGEAAIAQADIEMALVACSNAGRYAKDCGRHLWQSTFRADPAAGRALLPRLAAALPEHAAAFDPQREMIRAQEWKFSLRDQEDISAVECAGDAACDKVVRDLITDRWRAAAGGTDAEHWCGRDRRGIEPDDGDPLISVWLRIPAGAEAARSVGIHEACSGEDHGPAGRRGGGNRMRER